MLNSIKDEMNGAEGSASGLIPTKWNRNTVADGDWLQNRTLKPLSSRDNFLADKIDDTMSATYEEIEKINEKIDTLEAATDVIMVYNTYSAFSTNSGSLTLTDNDVIKVLNDEERQENQTYYQYDTDTSAWSFIGELEPYYSKTEIDTYSADISGTISTNYLSADTNAVIPGNNIVITKKTGPTIEIKTSSQVAFDGISSNLLSASTAYGQSAKFDDISGANIYGVNSSSTIYNLIDSAQKGSYASAWIDDNKNKYVYVSATKCTIGNYNTASTTSNYYLIQGTNNTGGDYSFVQGNNNSAVSGSIAQGSINSAKDYSLAQGSHNTAKSWSVALGDSAYANNKSFAINYTHAENGSFALNYNWAGDSTVISTATNNSFSMGNNNSADQNSFVFGHNNIAYENFIYGTNNKGKNSTIIGNYNEILCYSAGASEDLHTTVVGNFAERITVPGITSNTWYFAHSQSAEKIRFSVGNGNADNQRSNALTLYDDGTLELAAKSNAANYQTGLKHTKITNKGIYGYFGSDSYVAFHPHNIIEGKNCFSWDTMKSTIGNRNNLKNINSRNIIIYGGDENSWIGFYVTATPQNYVYNSLHFKIMRANPLVGYNLFFAIPSAYSITWNSFGFFSASNNTWCNTPKYDYFSGTTPPSNSSTISITTTNVNYINSTDFTDEYCQIVCPYIPGLGIIDVYLDPKSNTFIMTKCGGNDST